MTPKWSWILKVQSYPIYVFLYYPRLPKFNLFRYTTISVWVTGHFETSVPNDLKWTLTIQGQRSEVHHICHTRNTRVRNFNMFCSMPRNFLSYASYQEKRTEWHPNDFEDYKVKGTSYMYYQCPKSYKFQWWCQRLWSRCKHVSTYKWFKTAVTYYVSLYNFIQMEHVHDPTAHIWIYFIIHTVGVPLFVLSSDLHVSISKDPSIELSCESAEGRAPDDTSLCTCWMEILEDCSKPWKNTIRTIIQSDITIIEERGESSIIVIQDD